MILSRPCPAELELAHKVELADVVFIELAQVVELAGGFSLQCEKRPFRGASPYDLTENSTSDVLST